MVSPDDWATAVRAADVLQRGLARALGPDEPVLLIPSIAQNPILCGGPVEFFSSDMPVHAPKIPDDSLLPIDILYGRYDPNARSIEVFVNRIRKDASVFGAEADELRDIIRLHEYAHAVVHLGTRVDEVHKQMTTLHGALTAWPEFLGARTSWFMNFPAELHEFLAQALTYAALSKLSSPERKRRLRKIFNSLESKQGAQYQLSSAEKQWAVKADWRLVLDAARDADNIFQGDSSKLRAGLAALVSPTPSGTAI